jgi:hypothetical protein
MEHLGVFECVYIALTVIFFVYFSLGMVLEMKQRELTNKYGALVIGPPPRKETSRHLSATSSSRLI